MVFFTIINDKGVRFEKSFPNPYLANKFKNKAKRSKLITIVAEWSD